MIPLVALVLTLVTTVSVALAQQGRPDTQAFLVKDINDTFDTAAGSSPGPFVEAGGAVFFIADDGTSPALWRTDGTPAGTVMVKAVGGRTHSLFNFNGTPYFVSQFSPFSQDTSDKLWKSDGTAEGTVLVAGDSGAQPPRPTFFSGFTVVNDTIFFVSKFDIQWSLWKSDGTPAGTVRIRTGRCWPPSNLTNVNGTLFFTAFRPDTGYELWKSDGTEQGTVLVKDIEPGAGSSSPGNLANVKGTLMFSALQAGTGRELWRSDGTPDGTVLVKDIVPGAGSSYPTGLGRVNSTLFFTASRPDTGRELWKSDGTEAGTVLVKDIVPGPGSGAGSGPGFLTAVNGTLFFTVYHYSGDVLWKSDGTEAGTVLVKDIYQGGPQGSWISNLTAVNGTLFFTDFRPETGYELWKSDGTEQGTVLVKDVTPGPDSSGATPLIGVNGVLFFRTSNPLGLWRTDGTEAGTALIREGIFPLGPSYPNRCGGGLAAVNNLLVFVVQRGACELWRSDGVTADFLIELPGAGNALRMVSGLVLFSVYDSAHGRELWATDGTSVGMVQDIAPGPAWSSPGSFTPVGPLVLFQANGQVTGAELWAMSKSAIHRTLNLPEPSPDVAAQEGPSPKRREPANESRAFPPAFQDDPDELVASERETP